MIGEECVIRFETDTRYEMFVCWCSLLTVDCCCWGLMDEGRKKESKEVGGWKASENLRTRPSDIGQGGQGEQ